MASRFLISRLSALGDVVCTLPVATALKRGHPGCEVVWACDPRFSSILECCPSVDRTVLVRPGFRPSSWPAFDEPFEAALDMQGLLKSAVVVWRAKAEKKLGYHWQREGAFLFSSRVVPDPTSLHVVDQYVDVARAAGGLADRAEFNLVPKPEDCQAMAAKLAERGVGARFVVLNPGAAWATKRWPSEHCARLADMLHAEGIDTVLIGSKVEKPLGDSIRALTGHAADMVGETNVRQLVALISLASAHVGGDTGSTHIAAALGVPAIGLYSITRPERSGPYGQIDRCHYDPQGLRHIRPEPVFRTVLEALR